MGTVHVHFTQYKDVRAQVLHGRGRGMLLAASLTKISFMECVLQLTLLSKCVVASGVALAQNATRRPPHCFNLLRQVRILQKAGMGSAETQMKDSCNLFRFWF